MIRKEGVLRPMRGMGAVVLGAGPAHAMYFSSYECLRDCIARHSVLNTTLSSGKFTYVFKNFSVLLLNYEI